MPFEPAIAALVQAFLQAPHDSFHERELHDVFFGVARPQFGTAHTADNFEVSLLRHEYETIWLYQRTRAPAFAVRCPEQILEGATTGCFDFALLRRSFVTGHNLITVINKNEPNRRTLRPQPGQPWPNTEQSVPIDAAAEFKMAHRQLQLNISQGQINALRKGMSLDCRKLGRERVPTAYVLGFSHGPLPNQAEATVVLQCCMNEFANSYDGPQDRAILRAMIATPEQTFLSNNWENANAMPQAAVLNL